MAIDWKIAAVGGAVIVAGFFVFQSEISGVIDRIQVKDGNISIVQNVTLLTSSSGNGAEMSPEELLKVKEQILEHTTGVIGMHPVAFSYFIRSARCSYHNHAEMVSENKIGHFESLHETTMARVWIVDNDQVQVGFGGPGIIVHPTKDGKMLLLAYGINPQDCPIPQGAAPIVPS